MIRGLAEAQHGVVSMRQLLGLGVGEDLVRSRVYAGHLVPLHRGVFALGHRLLGQRGTWMAAVLACGPGAVLSHASAAALWGVRGSRGPTEVTRRSGGGSHPGVRIHQTKLFSELDVTVEAAIPVTTVERALLDIAAGLDEKRLERAVVAADRSGRLRWARLRRLLERTPRRPGASRLLRVSEAVDPVAVEARSPAEVDFLALCRQFRLPTPAVNVLVEDHLVDFLWPVERVVVETDGYRYHADRPAFERDREVTARLEAAGYRVHRATYKMLARPDRFMRTVARSLAHGRESSSRAQRPEN